MNALEVYSNNVADARESMDSWASAYIYCCFRR